MKLIGTAPIHPALFALAKTALLPPYLFLGVAALHFSQSRLASPALAVIGFTAYLLGLAIVLLAARQLGTSLRAGLPEESTAFKTHGLYRFSRNPIYLGVFVSMLGSCLMVPHWFNLGSTTLAIVLHHRIVLGEERFLAGRFGDAWNVYRSRVRRYL